MKLNFNPPNFLHPYWHPSTQIKSKDPLEIKKDWNLIKVTFIILAKPANKIIVHATEEGWGLIH